METKIFALFILHIFFAGTMLSQPAIRLPFNKKISTDDGLSSYNIKKIIQDKYGFIWILTQDGLTRYDGKNFVVYNKSTDRDHQLLESDVWDIVEEPGKDTVWVATAYGGINGINLKTGKVFFKLSGIEKEGTNSNWLKYLGLYKDDLWIGTYNGLAIYNIKTKSFERFEPLPPAKEQNNKFCIDKIVIDRFDNAWLLIANYGVVIYSCKSRKILSACPLSKLSLEYKATYRQFQTVKTLPDGSILTATNQGFRHLSADKNGKISVSVGLFPGDTSFNRININGLDIDSFQNIWFSAASKLFKFDKISKLVQEVKDANISVQNDWFNSIREVFFDKNNNIWLGTQRGVAFTKNATPVFNSYYVAENQAARIDHAFYLYPINDSVVYACTETGLLKVNPIYNTITELDKGKSYYFMTRHVDENFLVSNQSGFFVYKPGDNSFYEISKFYPELEPIRKMTVNSMIYAGDSIAVLGTENGDGLFIWNYKNRSLRKITHGPGGEQATQIINTCYTDKKNRIWVLGDNHITVYDPSTSKIKNIILPNPLANAPYTFFFDVCEAKGYFWLAVYGSGLLQLNDDFSVKKLFSVKDGLSNAGVYKTFPIDDSVIFITTNNGLSVFNVNQETFSNYYREDGLHSNAFEEGCGAYKNGKIYAGGVNGFTIINPKYLATNGTPPGLYLNHVRIETESGTIDTSNILLNNLSVPKDVLQTTFYFSALNFSDPYRVTYAYRIKELNKSWTNLGTQNSVSIMGLPPGKYTLLVRSANENGVWNETPMELSLHYLPRWYQTLLFKILLFAAITGLLYSFYAYRISQLKKQQKIRKDISADLHDDIGSILEGIKNYTHLAKKEPGKQEHLNQIEESLTQASTGFRDIIWILDDREDTVHQFMERVKKIALPISHANDIHFESAIEPGLNEKILTKTEKRHLLMIVKESINNSIKYSGCKNITVAIETSTGKFALLVKDDGKGFDVETASEGNGLKNINYRATQIGYRAEVTSIPGMGTRIRVFKI